MYRQEIFTRRQQEIKTVRKNNIAHNNKEMSKKEIIKLKDFIFKAKKNNKL